jgi:putative flippase GtrA
VINKHKLNNLSLKHKDKMMYFVVGILAFVVDSAAFTICRKLNLSIGSSNVVAMLAGMTTSFSLNWKVVFKNKHYKNSTWLMIGLFLILNAFNWWFSTNFIKLVAPLIESLSATILNLNLSTAISEFFAKIGSIATIILWNFIIYKKIIFKEKN